MQKKIQKIMVVIMAGLLSFQTMNINILNAQTDSNSTLKPGEVTQKKSAKWVDYGKGIAEVSFDVEGKNEEEPMDVVLVYDNSGSMQVSPNGTYSESRWSYASSAAKTFANELLKNGDNNIMLIPFSDKLIDGNSLHENPSDLFESHEFLYDDNGNPDIRNMQYIYSVYAGFKDGKVSEEEWIETFKSVTGFLPKEMKEVDNTKNAVVPFTNDVSLINNAVDSLYPSYLGLTNYEVALNRAKEALSESSASRKIVVMISDGKPTSGNCTQVANEIKESGVTIYTVGTGIKDEEASTLKAIATKEGGDPFYTSAEPSELSNVLESLRQQFDRAASNAEIVDEINTDYFEYYSDSTYQPTVNGIVIRDDELLVSSDKSRITWLIGNITETKKTLRFYIKVNQENLNDIVFNEDTSLLNKDGLYKTNNEANLSYKDINSQEMVESGHEMESPEVSVSTASMKKLYYVSDASGNYILENGSMILLDSEVFTKKALHVNYTIEPESSITINGKKYIIYKDDNTVINKTFTEDDRIQMPEFSFRYVEQMNVTFHTNGYGEFDDKEASLLVPVDHTSMTIPTLPEIQKVPSYMKFQGWNTKKDGLGDMFTSETQIKNNMNVYAQWKEDNKYTVTFEDEAGNELKSERVYEGESATAPKAPTKEGYTFVGWDYDFTNVTSDLTVKAQYAANQYTVKFDGNGSTNGAMEDQAFIYDEKKALSENTFTKEHHTFVGWLYNGVTYKNKEEVKNLISTANEEVTLVAQWREDNKYTVTFEDEAGNELKSERVYEGEGATAPEAPTKEGYTFVGWDHDFTNVTSDLTVKAQYAANQYTVKFDGNGSTNGAMEDQTFVYDEKKALSENTFTKEHHTFVGWLYNGVTYKNKEEIKNLISTVNGEVTFVAQWEENNQYTVIFQDEAGNELKSERVYEGENATAPGEPTKEGYTFIGWDQEFTNVTSDLIVTVVWEREDGETTVPPTTPVTPDVPVTPELPLLPEVPVNPIIPIVPVVPVVVPVQPVQPNLPNQEEPVQQPEVEVVPDNENPKAKLKDNETPKAKNSSAWALVNLICSILTILLVIAIILGKRKKEEEEEEQTMSYKRRTWTMVASVFVALGSAIAFILTEDISLPMIMIDKWTFLMVAILFVQIAMLVLAKRWKKEEEETVVAQS